MKEQYKKSIVKTLLNQNIAVLECQNYILAVLDDSQCPERNPNDDPISEIPNGGTICAISIPSAGDHFTFQCTGSSETFVLTFESVSCAGACEEGGKSGTRCDIALSINDTPPNPCFVTTANDWDGCDPCLEGSCDNF